MPPESLKSFYSGPVGEEDIIPTPSSLRENVCHDKSWRNLWCYFGEQDIKWINVLPLFGIHFYGLYTLFISQTWKPRLFLFYWAYSQFSGFGVTAGAHRYYTHKAYKAKLPLRIIMMLGYTSMGENSLFHWVRDHRVHHKFSDTDADPHNASRGFFFSHCGWLLMKKHPEVIKQGRKIDMSDVLEDPVVQFHEKYFFPLWMIFCHLIPIFVPWYFWNYELRDCFDYQIVRWIAVVNVTWCVNSVAHLWGNRPYDKNICPVENVLLSFVGFGEGWHNYHHTFPWDYKAAELSWWLNTCGILLNLFAAIGWAYDLKTPSKELIEKVCRKNGDGSHYKWGKEVPEEDDKMPIVMEKSY